LSVTNHWIIELYISATYLQKSMNPLTLL
jgi:hypothetical protein